MRTRDSAPQCRRRPRLSLPAHARRHGGASAGMSAAIEVANLRREFRARAGLFTPDRRVVAVDDVSFQVPAGSVLGIVGQAGCGKSTPARLILGFLAPTPGAALIEGQ